ncbi:hypothetical protein, conserved [Trypanosoma brucei brucei TREU927]|uniref:Uncharacterized protein n=1 Tax=Trypanosoma brucei brucei (strain 927/4 GUTat10.1) TaxID=185431 RepID=Q387F3_TRYB2|nr:hypothetical protein, conserved [Trypanosoma brucei brucei TREU927]EAN79078.1 hypothetical protein, conserved [Trypanosoma brucei brucei TREU927]
MDWTDRVLLEDDNDMGKSIVSHHVLMNCSQRSNIKDSNVQTLSTEMLHWDDYREAHGINDGTPKMADTFQNACEPLFQGHVCRSGGSTKRLLSVATKPVLGEGGDRTFCSEMQHWDDYRVKNNIQDGSPAMQCLFRQFDGHDMFILDSGWKLLTLKQMCITSTRQAYGASVNQRVSEMVRWEESQNQQGINCFPASGSAEAVSAITPYNSG